MEVCKTLEEVNDLFKNYPSFGVNNNFFIGCVTTSSPFGGLFAGLLAYKKNNCYAYLVNQSEKGIGLIPIHQKGSLRNTLDKMTLAVEEFGFIPQDSIKSVRIKNFIMISSANKQVILKLENGKRYDWLVYKKVKNVGYHQEGFARFQQLYKKYKK